MGADAQPQNNPWANENPTNSDFFQMITEQNMRDGDSKAEAEGNAVREMQHYMKNGINPMGPINGREAGYNESQGSRLNREGKVWQQQQDAKRAAQHEANLINPAGQSFGEYIGQESAIAQDQQNATQKIRDAQNSDFGKWLVQEQLNAVAAKEAKDRAFGKMIGQSIMDPGPSDGGMQRFKNLKLADDPVNFDLPTIKY